MVLIIGCSIWSCEQDRCAADAGDIDTVQLDIGWFGGVKCAGLFDVELIQDTCKKVIIKGPEKMIANLHLEWEGSNIRINDMNTCYWMRNFERMKVYVHSDTLRSIVLQGACKLESRNTIITPRIRVIALTDVNEVDVTLQTDDLLFYNNGAVGGIYEFSGYAKKALIEGYANARITTNDFVSEYCVVRHNSVADFYFDMQGPVELSMHSSGNFYYQNDSTVIITEETGSGQAISWKNE